MESHRRINILRICFGLVLFASIGVGPYWVPGLLALGGYVWFPLYWEMFFAAVFFDLLYYVPSPVTHGIPVFATMLALTLLALLIFLGERLRLPTRKGRS